MTDQEENQPQQSDTENNAEEQYSFYRIQLRPNGQSYNAASKISGLRKNEVVMVQTDHGLEPALLMCPAPNCQKDGEEKLTAAYMITRRGTRDEGAKYEKLDDMEKTAFAICGSLIDRHQLPMRLISVERFFNGGKIIFYFTAESRVDFRELVKNLVQEFRTRVEMRQIGVRHETKMIGGLGCCGRELCCSLFINNFESVSIKMAKEQNLPLNPAKISGVCNRLLCCLNYEFKTYRSLRKNMPKIGKNITIGGQSCKVIRHNILEETIVVSGPDNAETTIGKEEWRPAAAADPREK